MALNIEMVKYLVCIPVFIYWTIYDMVTKKVKEAWIVNMYVFSIGYNLVLLVTDHSLADIVKARIPVCIAVMIFGWFYHKVKGMGMGDVYYYSLISLLFSFKVLVLSVAVSFFIFHIFVEIIIIRVLRIHGEYKVAFFPFITAGLISSVLVFERLTSVFFIK